jgi:major membrane immunogen (membrane-anchored lipoprotein)
MKAKRILVVLMCALMLVGLCACGKKDGGNDEIVKLVV